LTLARNRAVLVLDDGSTYRGAAFGEVVRSTSMSGHKEMFADRDSPE